MGIHVLTFTVTLAAYCSSIFDYCPQTHLCRSLCGRGNTCMIFSGFLLRSLCVSVCEPLSSLCWLLVQLSCICPTCSLDRRIGAWHWPAPAIRIFKFTTFTTMCNVLWV